MTRTDATGFRAVLAGYSSDVTAIALAARSLVLSVLPEVYEVVWPIQRNIGYGTGPKKQTEHFAWIAPATSHVSFGFNYGAELADPARLLEGNGKKFRHTTSAVSATPLGSGTRASPAGASAGFEYMATMIRR